MPPLFLFIYY
jgi:hypothetical protein